MLPLGADTEGEVAEARHDLLAWAGGAVVWGGVTALILGQPAGIAVGACLAFLLRRSLRLFVEF
ncbi:MAG TPA: hypothetical protein VEB20_01730 [Azospirillaceae bacterium]|nr:hypothetical protein [Azospirillaceae bacterium]